MFVLRTYEILSFMFFCFLTYFMSSRSCRCAVYCKKLCWWPYFTVKEILLSTGRLGKSSGLENKQKKSGEIANQRLVMPQSQCMTVLRAPCLLVNLLVNTQDIWREQINSERVFLSCHVLLDTLFPVQKPHSRNLHILLSSSPLPAHCLRHLVSCTSSSALLERQLLHIIWDEKITGGAQYSCELHRKQIYHWNLNPGVYFPIHCSGADPWWWMIIIYSAKAEIYLLWLHLMCSLDAHSFTLWQCELTVIVMGSSQDWAYGNAALRSSSTYYEWPTGRPLKKKPVGFLM